MIEVDGLQIQAEPPAALFRLEVWGNHHAVQDRWGMTLPEPCRSNTGVDARVLWWEPSVWLAEPIKGAREEVAARLNLAAGADGAVTDVGGAYRRLSVQGPLWRRLLMIGGVFDAESQAFGPGCVIGTVIHHIAVRVDVIGENKAIVFVAPSYADALLGLWRTSALRLGPA